MRLVKNLVVSALLAAASASHAQTAPIKIGFLGELSGPQGALGGAALRMNCGATGSCWKSMSASELFF